MVSFFCLSTRLIRTYSAPPGLTASENEMVNQKRHGPFPHGASLIDDINIYLINTYINIK